MTISDSVVARLTDFQRNSVAYILERFYGPESTRRFLLADEVGMGKTLVARGVIAGAIDKLREPDSGVDRIDVLYICSNANIARQNISKLDVLGEGTRPMSTRITMMAMHMSDLNHQRADGQTIVNLVAFTPGTSFQKGHSGGRVEERALLSHFTEPLFRDEKRVKALRKLLRGGVSGDRWKRELESIHRRSAPPDATIGREYLKELRGTELERQLRRFVDVAVTQRQLSAQLKDERRPLIGELRHVLAKASVAALEPDLIILDEFQRFRHLIETSDEGTETEVSELARELFEWKDARILLLSATPYKLYTLPEEQELTGDDHYRDFLSTVRFLADTNGEALVDDLESALAEFRTNLIEGSDATPARDQAQALLRSVMCRTERPTLGDLDLLNERLGEVDAPTADDLASFVRMRRLAKHVNGAISVEYWKSAPYFLSFMDGYQLSRRVRERADDPAVLSLVTAGPSLSASQVRGNEPIEAGNARLRALQRDVIDAEMHRLLWMPPSMPYHLPAGVSAGDAAANCTKRLIFSSWAAAPTSIAALLSHAALRSLDPNPSERSASRLTYDADEHGHADRMSTLLLTVPQPGLATVCDPLAAARRHGPETATLDGTLADIRSRVSPDIAPPGPSSQTLSAETWYWHTPLTWDGHVAVYPDARHAIERVAAGTRFKGLAAHLARAQASVAGEEPLGDQPDDLDRWVAMVGLASPANCAWRALRRVTAQVSDFADDTFVVAAVMIGEGFRTLFNRAEVMSLIDSQSTERAYWRRVLEYCAAGNLQGVLDEYFHHLVGDENVTDDESLLALAARVANTVAFGLGRVEAFDPTAPETPIRMPTRFALRYGTARGTLAKDDESIARAGDVQAAFNSPFWPFVLASTSVGQESVDFHWWCHSLIHWNQPANVVDLEQREGRVHRYRGHAIRKNVAAKHRTQAMESSEADPWVAAFDAAASQRPPEMDDLWPSWVYPGPAKVECWVPYLPLSKEIEHRKRLQRDRALYRLAFGQPRQEDLLAVLEARGADPSLLADLRINLRPPARSRRI